MLSDVQRRGLPADYHVHSEASDGGGHVDDLVARATDLGLPEIGVSDHVIGVAVDDGVGVPHDRLADYVADVRAAAAASTGPRVLLGMEVDYTRDTLAEVSALVERYRPDYVIGSVHILHGFAFDSSRYILRYRHLDLEQLWIDYFETVAEGARSGLFTVFGHFDLIKKFGLRPAFTRRIVAAAGSALEAMAAAGVAIELNTAGWRKPVGEQYPSRPLLRRAHDLGLPLTFGSDAHSPAEVGEGFREAVVLAREAGYRSWLRLSDRRQIALGGWS